jgi:hypothetical protein
VRGYIECFCHRRCHRCRRRRRRRRFVVYAKKYLVGIPSGHHSKNSGAKLGVCTGANVRALKSHNLMQVPAVCVILRSFIFGPRLLPLRVAICARASYSRCSCARRRKSGSDGRSREGIGEGYRRSEMKSWGSIEAEKKSRGTSKT